MKFTDFIEVVKMVKEAEKEMKATRFWWLAFSFGGGWLAFGLARLVESLK